MPPERPTIPDWARYEREADLEWIGENLDLFWTATATAFPETGRGVIMVDVTTRPAPDVGHPFGYVPQAQIDAYGDEDIIRMAAAYDPERELVIVLLKPEDRTSTYRVCAIPPEPEPTAPAQLEVPDIETLMAWEEDGGCEAACPYGCWVEPDGTCPHGHPSWLLKLGLI